MREWLAADADPRDVHDKSLGQGIACDPTGCIGKLSDGELVAYVLAPVALEEDCRRAALVIATRGDPPADCKAVVISRALWRQHGALALRLQTVEHGAELGEKFVIDAARPRNFDRPWGRARVVHGVVPPTIGQARGEGATVHPSRDATPRQEDIETDQ